MKLNLIKNLNYSKILLMVFPILLAGIYFIATYKRPFVIIPESKATEFNVTSYSDKIFDGHSDITIEDTTKSISYSYELKEGYKFNFASINLSRTDSAFFDISNYDDVVIKMQATKGTRIPFLISVLEPNVKKKDGTSVYRLLQKTLNVNSNIAEIKVKLNELMTPDWWYSDNNFKEDDFHDPDLSHVKEISFASCINLGQNKKDIVTIEELRFQFNFIPFLIKAGSFFIFYYLVLFFVYNRKKAEKISLNFNYDKIEFENYQSKEESLVFDYLASNYSKQDLTITDLQNKLGLHEKKISTIIKVKSGLNFKQFLNQLRLSEAKRILKSSDLPVAEIAFKLGYSNSTHFNRVFKAAENCSPNEYRKNKRQSFSKEE